MTRTAVVWIASGLRLACLLLFPGLAVWAWRAGGTGRLWRLTGAAVGFVLGFAAVAASSVAGNMLAPSHGYRYTAPRSLGLYALLLGLPMVLVAATVPRAGGRIRSALGLYAIGLLVAVVAWVAATVLMLVVFYGPLH